MTAHAYKKVISTHDTQKMVDKPHVSIEEYLKREFDAETRSEYLDGEIVAMSGASPDHNRISGNINGEFYIQLKETSCEAFASETRTWVEDCGSYFYPDIVAACGVLRYNSDNPPALLNPTLIVEILSDSTEAYDRGRKFRCYRAIASLREILFVSQYEPLIEHYRRQTEDLWIMSAIQGMEASITLESLPCTLKLSDIYSRITWR